MKSVTRVVLVVAALSVFAGSFAALAEDHKGGKGATGQMGGKGGGKDMAKGLGGKDGGGKGGGGKGGGGIGGI